MDKKELAIKLSLIESERNEKRHEAFKEYALSNNPYKIGDIITDHICSIKIEKIKIYISSYSSPEVQCFYIGTLVSKTGKLFKNNKQSSIFQKNIIKGRC